MYTLGYNAMSRLMEDHAKYLGYDTYRINGTNFKAGDIQFKRTNIHDPALFRLCKDKQRTKDLVASKGLSVAKSYNIDSVQFPCVVKPLASYGSKGVTIVHKEEDLQSAIKHASHRHPPLIEEFVAGYIHRVITAKQGIVSILKQVPPNVVGNGILTVQELINQKNKGRGKTLADAPLKVQLPVDLNRIPKLGEVVQLSPFPNRIDGSDLFQVKDTINDIFKQFALACRDAIPGLIFGGLDIVYDYQNPPVFIEINFTPGITAHYFPQDDTDPVYVHKYIIESYL